MHNLPTIVQDASCDLDLTDELISQLDEDLETWAPDSAGREDLEDLRALLVEVYDAREALESAIDSAMDVAWSIARKGLER